MNIKNKLFLIIAITLIALIGFFLVYEDDSELYPTYGEDDIKKFIDASDSIDHVSVSSRIEGLFGTGVAVADFNGDGLDDLFLTNHNESLIPRERFGKYGSSTNSLYINKGDSDGDGLPEFSEVARESGVLGKNCKCSGVAVGDYNNDGKLDMYVTQSTHGYNNPLSYNGAGVGGMEDMVLSDLPPSPITDGTYSCEGRNILFENTGNKDGVPQFRDVTQKAKVTECRNGKSAAFSDIDLDGDLDLYVGNYIDPDYFSFRESFFNGSRNTLYLNNGDGTFTDITSEAGVGGRAMSTFTRDGDKVSTFNPDLRDSEGNRVGSNNSNTLAVGFMDYNNDRYPDLFVANDTPGVVSIFLNKGDGSFKDVTNEAGTNLSGAWMGIAFGDINGDAVLDMFNTNWGSEYFTHRMPGYTKKQEATTAAKMMLWGKSSYANKLWRFDGTRSLNSTSSYTFPDLADIGRSMDIDWGALPPYASDHTVINYNFKITPLGLEEGEMGFGTTFLDFDNDTREDLYWVGSLYNQGAGRLLQNIGNDGTKWRDVTFRANAFNVWRVDPLDSFLSPSSKQQKGRGVAKGDFNNDGYPDLVITNAGEFNFEYNKTYTKLPSYRPGRTILLMNPGYDNNWLKVDLEGTKSNISAIGAVVKAYLPGGKVLVDQVTSGTSFLSNNSLTLMFGLGNASEVEKLTVLWPNQNSATNLYNIDANQTIKIKENQK